MTRWLAAIAAAGVMALTGCAQRARSGPDPPPAVREPSDTRAADAAPDAPRPVYREIVGRNVFRPLVEPARAPAGSGGEAASPGAERSATAPQPPARNAQPPDPMADLALTGVVEVDRRLQALIERISTRVGRYVAVGQEFDGYRVAQIYIDAVQLEKDGRRHTLRMGDKELDQTPSGSASAEQETSRSPDRPTAPQPAPSFGPGQMAGDFGGDMLGWAERQPLRTLERMFGQYSGFMSPDQRRQAEEYLQDRRRREGR